MNRLTRQIVVEARKHVGVREQGRNDGPEIRTWLARVFRRPGTPWCAAFAWCMLDDACDALDIRNPMPATAGVYLLMVRARALRAWTRDFGIGFIFGIDHGKDRHGNRLGHCGIVVGNRGELLFTIEGNTNPAGSHEGDGIYERTRTVSECTLGFLDPGKLIAEKELANERVG